MIKYFKYLLAVLFFSIITGFSANAVFCPASSSISPIKSTYTIDKESVFVKNISIFSGFSFPLLQSLHCDTRRLTAGTIPASPTDKYYAILIFETGLKLNGSINILSINYTILDYGKLLASILQRGDAQETVSRVTAFKNKIAAVALKPENVNELLKDLNKSKNKMPVCFFDTKNSNNYPDIIETSIVFFNDARKYKLLSPDYPAYGGCDVRVFLHPVKS